MRRAVGLFGAAIVAGAMLAGTTAAGAAPAGGEVKAFVTLGTNGKNGHILLAGAIGDHGTSLTVNKSGQADANGNFVKVTLTRGGFWLNISQLNQATNNAQPSTDSASTCSFAGTGTGPVTVYNGSGLYSGVSGTLSVTVTFAGIGPRYTSGSKKGQCNMSNNATPVAQFSVATATGDVSFS
jgi:hypothetical protein